MNNSRHRPSSRDSVRGLGTTRAAALAAASLGAISMSGSLLAQDITRPGDPITASSTNFPAGENPSGAIDDTAQTKYLNFDRLNTGFTVTPSGAGVVRAIGIITGDDAPERDPTSFILEGSDDGVNFTMIASGPLNPSTARRAFDSARFNNNATYSQYRVTFPTIRNAAGANSMQVCEVSLLTATNIITAGDPFTVTYTPGASSPANEGPANLFDHRAGTKMGIFSGNIGPTFIQVTPGLGATTVTGLDLFSGNDDQGFPGRTPQYVTLYGSTNGTTFTQIFTTTLTAATQNYQSQQFSFPNTTAYTSYQLELGPSMSDGFLQLGEFELFGTASNAPPANDTCSSAQQISAGTIGSANFNATGTDDTPCGTGDSSDVWFSYTAPTTGIVEVNTLGTPALDTTLAVYAGCGGTLLGCDDNSRGSASRVRFNAVANTNYRVRVAGSGGATGAFSLTLIEGPVLHNDLTVPLAYNFNGMVQPGEAGTPDRIDGYRSISDRGLRVTGAVGSIDVGLEGRTGIRYSVVSQAGVLDVVHLGDRNVTDGGRWAFDNTPGTIDPPDQANNIGVQPSWLGCTDQTAIQTTDTCRLGAVMGPDTQIGVLYQISNGGGSFDLSLGFDDGSSVVVPLQGPDWFGDQVPGPANPGVASQQQLGVFFGTQATDIGSDGVDLNVVEGVISAASVLTDLGIDISGHRLTSIGFGNQSSLRAGYAILAASVRDPASVTPGACGPAAIASATPTGNDGASSTHFSFTIQPGTLPAGTGTQVIIDVTPLGGQTAQAFDDGAHNDGAAGDNVFGLDYPIPANSTPGNFTLNYTFSDGQGRNGSGTVCLNIFAPPPPPPANDNCANATPISGAGTYAFDTSSATADGPALCEGNGSGSVWFAYTGPVGSVATVSICGQASFDTVLAAVDSCGGASLACNDDTCGTQSEIVLPASTGAAVLIRVSGFGGATGAGSIVITVAGGCRIDFNQDGDINADDLGDFITCYFSIPPCAGADFNGTDGVNADDLGDFITAYFEGC